MLIWADLTDLRLIWLGGGGGPGGGASQEAGLAAFLDGITPG